MPMSGRYRLDGGILAGFSDFDPISGGHKLWFIHQCFSPIRDVFEKYMFKTAVNVDMVCIVFINPL